MVIAFIPVRGGSKSIPLKNIKLLYGKPLVYWTLAALERINFISEIIVATDSDVIEKTVLSFLFKKTRIYRRLSVNASDTSSTESVMLEYIEKGELSDSDIFILVQATSPLTQSEHFTEAYKLYKKNKYDSLVTCVRNYRFFWDANGISKNYDYQQRPRRQDFKGQLMENGAFYISTVGNIKMFKNRLSGNIGIYEMPEYTAVEIDEPDDWAIVEKLMRKYVAPIVPRREVKLFLTDVDGVLTDSGMYYSKKGDEIKKFNTRDGMAFEILRNAGIITGFVTSEKTRIVENRAKKLKIDFIIQNKRNEGKLSAALKICSKLGVSLDETLYIGDDINCKELLEQVGHKFCPKDAVKEIKEIVGINIIECKGGNGVVRNIVEEYLKNIN
jgi:N-acylneuraminate cytidylyltransferase